MSDVTELNEQEKVFLAGAIKAMLLVEGRLERDELDDLDRLIAGLGFDDFDEHLARFETDVKSDEDFEYLARNLYHPEAKSLITRVLWDLAIQRGFASPEETSLIKNIRSWWKMEKS